MDVEARQLEARSGVSDINGRMRGEGFQILVQGQE